MIERCENCHRLEREMAGMVNDTIQELKKNNAELEMAKTLLRVIEHIEIAGSDDPMCPFCLEREGRAHNDECALAKVIGAPRAPARQTGQLGLMLGDDDD